MPKPSRRAPSSRDSANSIDRQSPIDSEREAPGEPYPPGRRSTAEAFGFEVPKNYPFAGVASEGRRGRFFGRGPKGYRRSDERILEEISDRLMTHPDIDPSDLEVTVSRGVVTLSGSVEDRHEKRLAEYIAEDVLGVDDVENRLKVRHGFWAALSGDHGVVSDAKHHRMRSHRATS